MSVPQKMLTPQKGLLSTIDKIEVYWAEMTTMEETGGTFFISSYELQMRVPSGNWTSLVGGISSQTDLAYLKTGLVTGINYVFRVRASNSYGWGPYSDEATIRTDDVPE